jgi:phytoene synthase
MTTPIQYCYEKVAAHGSPVYYSIKKVKPEKRDGLIIIEAFYQELENVLLKNSDLELAHQQLNWWKSEVIKIPQGLASHPVTRAMSDTGLIDIQRYFDIIDGIEQTLAFQSFDTFEDLVVHIMRTGGARELLLLDLLDLSDKIPQEIIYQYSMVVELVKYIQCLRHYVRRGLIMFSRDELGKFQISTELLQGFKTTPEIKNFLAYQVEKITQAYQKANASLTPLMRDRLKHLRARCDLSLATLREIQRSGFMVLENFIQLTPLKMWWVAYRI